MKKNNIIFNKLWLILVLLVSLKTFTQKIHIFPYSSFGIGEQKFNSDIVLNSMGKLSSCLSNELEINQINFSNPAANKYSLYTTFNINGNIDLYYLIHQKKYLNNNNNKFSNVSISFPIFKNIFFGLGFQPYTQFPYDKLYKEAGYYQQYLSLYYGHSGINSLHTVLSYHINNNLNLGLRINYLFGIFDKFLEFPDEKKNNFIIRDSRSYVFSGFQFTPGVYYSFPINNKKYKINTGLTLSSASNYLTDVNFSRLKYFYLTDGYAKKNKSAEIFVLQYTDNNLNTYLPFDYSIGFSLQQYKNWMLGVEFLSKQLYNFFLPKDYMLYKNQFRCSLGGFIIPNYKNYTNYLSRVIYRFGGYYENTGLFIFNKTIHQFGISCGLGLPIGEDKKNPSKLNIGFEIGKIGKINFPIHEEMFMKITIGLNLSEIWSNK